MINNIKIYAENKLRYNYYFKRELKAINEQKQWESSMLRERQEFAFLALVHQAYHQSSFYRHLYDLHKVDIEKIKKIEDIQRLPIITKDSIRDHVNTIFIGNRLNRSTAHTSGTTGSPLTLYRDYQSIVKEAAYQWSHRMSFGYEVGMKTVTLRGNLGKTQMESFDPHSNTLYLSSYNLSQNNAEWYYERIRDFAPQAILAYPSSLEILANYFQGMGKSLHVPLSFTSSESVYAHQREKVESAFDTKIVDWYGNAERTIALEQNALGLYDELPLYSVNEFAENYAITTSLINFSFPLIRYRVDDVFVTSDTEAGGPKVVESIQGRSNDYLILPDGTQVGLLCNAMKGIDHLLFAQIVQEHAHSFTLKLVVDDHFTEKDEQQVRNNIIKKVGSSAVFDIIYVNEDKIIRSKSGKFKMIINNVNKEIASEPELIASWLIIKPSFSLDSL